MSLLIVRSKIVQDSWSNIIFSLYNFLISFFLHTFTRNDWNGKSKQRRGKLLCISFFPSAVLIDGWTLSLEVLFAVENLLVSVEGWSVRHLSAVTAESHPFILPSTCVPFLFRFILFSLSFFFFHIFFSLPLLFRAMRRTSATARTLLKLHSCIRELLNFTGIGGGMVALPFEINISTVWKRTSSRDMQTMENYLLSILCRMVCFNLWKCKNVRRVKIDEGLEMWFEFLKRIIQLWNCNFKLDKNIKELRLRTMLNQNKNNFEISL